MSGEIARAYAMCAALAEAHYENFPVASRLLPASMRPHVAAVYAFARLADDMADEGDASAQVRQSRLRDWQRRLHDAATGGADTGGPDAAIVLALGHSIRTLDLPIELFDDLLSAFAQDTTTTRYDSWSDLFDYCRRSANPVGRLVLRIGGYADAAMDRSSDALCTALQLTNFWQDLGRDWRAGRLYVPREVSGASGAREQDLADGRVTAAWADALGRCVERTRTCYEQGRHVCDAVHGRLRLELRLTWLGGVRILERVDRDRASLLRIRPALGPADLPSLLWRAARWTKAAA